MSCKGAERVSSSMACSVDVVACLGVSGLGQVTEGVDADPLDGFILRHAPVYLGFQPGILVLQAVTRSLEFEMQPYPG
jgi:hypothetical protein